MNNSVPLSPEEWIEYELAREERRQYWLAKGFPWRTEPEIDAKRQEELSKCRATVPDIKKGIFPFQGKKLDRADVEWLLATHENGRGPVDWSDEDQRTRNGLDLRGANICKVDLRNLPLARLCGGLTPIDELQVPISEVGLEGRDRVREMATILANEADLSKAQLQGANLFYAQLQGARLSKAQLQWASLNDAQLQGADLFYAQLRGADLLDAQLQGARLRGAQLQDANLGGVQLQGAEFLDAQLQGATLYQANLSRADLRRAQLQQANLKEAQLQGADLRRAHLEGADLDGTILGDNDHVGPQVADIRWGETNLTVVDWSQIAILGEEHQAHQKQESYGSKKNKEPTKRLDEYKTAVRANRQLAVVLQDQGLNEDASRFAYRAQVLQRKVLWKQRDFWKWFGSAMLALLAGYGYRMWRILVAYLLVVLLCAIAYFVLGIYYEPHLSLLEAVLTSITAFHGRVFSEPFLRPDEPQLWVTAFEAIMGLVIEGVFIAMLTQKFFGK